MDFVKEKAFDLFKFIALGIIDNSYYICLFVCLGAIILYIAGLKKSGKWATGSIVVYFILQCLGSGLR